MKPDDNQYWYGSCNDVEGRRRAERSVNYPPASYRRSGRSKRIATTSTGQGTRPRTGFLAVTTFWRVKYNRIQCRWRRRSISGNYGKPGGLPANQASNYRVAGVGERHPREQAGTAIINADAHVGLCQGVIRRLRPGGSPIDWKMPFRETG